MAAIGPRGCNRFYSGNPSIPFLYQIFVYRNIVDTVTQAEYSNSVPNSVADTNTDKDVLINAMVHLFHAW